MKKIIISGLLLGCIGLMACKKDKTNINEAPILGKWNFEKVVTKNLSDQSETTVEKDPGSFVDFRQGGEAVINLGTSDINCTWKLLSNNSIELSVNPTSPYTISALSDTNFSYYYDTEQNGQSLRVTWHLTKPYIAP